MEVGQEKLKYPCIEQNFKRLIREDFQMNCAGHSRGSYLILEDGVD